MIADSVLIKATGRVRAIRSLSEGPEGISGLNIKINRAEVSRGFFTTLNHEVPDTDSVLLEQGSTELFSFTSEDSSNVNSVTLCWINPNSISFKGRVENLSITPGCQNIPIAAEMKTGHWSRIEIELSPASEIRSDTNGWHLKPVFELASSGIVDIRNAEEISEAMDRPDSSTILLPLPYSVAQTVAMKTELASVLEEGRPLPLPVTDLPRVYYTQIYVRNNQELKLLRAFDITYDFYPFFGSDAPSGNLPVGELDMEPYHDGLVVWAIINDVQYQMFHAYRFFIGLKVLQEIPVATLAERGFHLNQLDPLSDAEIDSLEPLMQAAVDRGVREEFLIPVFDEWETSIAANGSRGIWKSVKRGFRKVVRGATNLFKLRTLIDITRTVFNFLNDAVSFIFSNVVIVTSGFNTGRVEGIVSFLDKNGQRPIERNRMLTLKNAEFSVRGGVYFNGRSGKLDGNGYFLSPPVATNSFGIPIGYEVRVTLENRHVGVYNDNPYWPIVKRLGSVAPDSKIRLFTPKSRDVYTFGYTSYAYEESKRLFGFQPGFTMAVIDSGLKGELKNLFQLKDSVSAIAPAGQLGSAIRSIFGPVSGDFILNLDADIMFTDQAAYDKSTILHEYGHIIMFDALESSDVQLGTKSSLAYRIFADNAATKGEAPAKPEYKMHHFTEGWACFFEGITVGKGDGYFRVPMKKLFGGNLALSWPDAAATRSSYLLSDSYNLEGMEVNYPKGISGDLISDMKNQRHPQIMQVATLIYDIWDDVIDSTPISDALPAGPFYQDVIGLSDDDLTIRSLVGGRGNLMVDAIKRMGNSTAGNGRSADFHAENFYQYLSLTESGSVSATLALQNVYAMHGYSIGGNGEIINLPGGVIGGYKILPTVSGLRLTKPPASSPAQDKTTSRTSVNVLLNNSEQRTIVNNGIMNPAAGANASFSIEYPNGFPYNISAVSRNPQTQQCRVLNNTGTIAGADVTNIEVQCADIECRRIKTGEKKRGGCYIGSLCICTRDCKIDVFDTICKGFW